jgi:hypothetical protein
MTSVEMSAVIGGGGDAGGLNGSPSVRAAGVMFEGGA